MSEDVFQKVKQAEKYDHETIGTLYTGLEEAKDDEELVEKLLDNVVNWLKSLDQDTRLGILFQYMYIISEFEDELGLSMQK